jgi:hypothetical protein
MRAAAAALLLLLAALGVARFIPRPSARSPLAYHLLPSPVRFDGLVAERLEAGSYAYLRVTRAGEPDAWVVAMHPRAHAGVAVRIDAVGRARHFTSRRLGRDFDDLWFASARALP